MESLCSVLIWPSAIQGEQLPFTPPPLGILPFPLLWTVIPPVRQLVAHCPVKAHAQCPAPSLSQQNLQEALSRDGSFYRHKEPHGEMGLVTRPWLRSFGFNSGAPLMCWVTLGKPATHCRSVASSARVDTSTLTKYSRVHKEENMFHKAVYLCKSQLLSPIGRLH